MKVEIGIDAATTSAGRTFLTWAPVPARAWIADADGATGNVGVTLRNGGMSGGGRIVFDTVRSDDDKATLDLQLPADGTKVDFWVSGEFQQPSKAYGDAAIEAVAGGVPVGRRELMVRIRKNAVKLEPAERDRFLDAMGELNNAGRGPFQSFRDTHNEDGYNEAHGHPGFLPWHRAYLLDLERELQRIDDSVALPYWRFDEPAPSLFDAQFLAMPPPDPAHGDFIEFPHGHALEFWQTDGTGIERRPRYDIAGPPPTHFPDGRKRVINQDDTLALGADYFSFRGMELPPHGFAHTSFSGAIFSPLTAAKDPLFFLLHGNIDRLWAWWQWDHGFNDPNAASSFSATDPRPRPGPGGNIGHNLNDTMWPWNHEVTPPRPSDPAPRPAFPDSPIVSRPGIMPRIRDMIDYQGVHGGESLGFDYDDVPFEL